MCIQFTLNSLAIRFFAPKGVDRPSFLGLLGYDRDTEDNRKCASCEQLTVRQSGLAEEVVSTIRQRGTRNDPGMLIFMEMGGRVAESRRTLCD